MRAFLILEDGTVFTGTSIGIEKEIISEIVFNTSMSGYLEIMTDPSNAGQAVVMTYPLIGNYGVCYEDMESDRPWIDALIVRELSRMPSNFRSETSIQEFLKDNDIPGISGVDTRELTKILREKGTMNCMVTTNENYDIQEVLGKLKSHSNKGLVEKVSRNSKSVINGNKSKVALLDLGTKRYIEESLSQRNCEVTIYPSNTSAQEIINSNPDGVILSNGPGDPKDCVSVIEEVKKLYNTNIPIFAICLGHQLMALASGADTYKMKNDHRGANYPVKDLETGKVYISDQNHGYVVDENSIDKNNTDIKYINVNDNSVEGLKFKDKNILTVQFYPDETFFDEFIKMMEVKENA